MSAMKRLLAAVTIVALAACSQGQSGATGSPEVTTTIATTAAASFEPPPPAPASASAPPQVSATPAASTTAAPAASTAAPTASATASPATSAEVKTFDCGAKGQKMCPLQGWMKSVMAAAAASGDADKLAATFSTVAGRAPPGMGNWSSIANAGAAKARAGDIDLAKKSCEACHSAYKAKYKSSMRDRPF